MEMEEPDVMCHLLEASQAATTPTEKSADNLWLSGDSRLIIVAGR
jgi:hypothetical protein